MSKIDFKDTYFKDDGDHRILISARALPVDEDETVRNKSFEDCRFHPNCGSVKFNSCLFLNCDGVDYLSQNINAKIWNSSEV